MEFGFCGEKCNILFWFANDGGGDGGGMYQHLFKIHQITNSEWCLFISSPSSFLRPTFLPLCKNFMYDMNWLHALDIFFEFRLMKHIEYVHKWYEAVLQLPCTYIELSVSRNQKQIQN